MIEIDPLKWGLGSHKNNQIKICVFALIPIESSNSVKHYYLFRPPILNKQLDCFYPT